MPTPRTPLIVLLAFNALGYVIALATGLADPLPGLINGSKTNAPLVIWGAETIGVVLLLRGRRAGGVLALLAATISLAAAAFDGDLGAGGLGAGQVAVQVSITVATVVLWASTAAAVALWSPGMRQLAVVLALVALLAAPASAGAKRLVRYDVTGGLAPRSERLVIDRNGSARQTGSRSGTQRFTVSAKQLRALKRELKAALPRAQRAYQPPFPVLDGITQSVTYGGRSVSIYTNAKPPERLRRVLQRLSRLMRT